MNRPHSCMPVRLTRRLLLAALMLFSFGTFRFFPGLASIHEGWIVLLLLVAGTLYIKERFEQNLTISALEAYIIVLCTVLPLSAGIMAWWEFGQPIIYGVLSNRQFVLTLGAAYLLMVMRWGYITLEDIDRVLITMAWMLLVIYTVAYVAINPVDFIDYGLSFVGRKANGEFFLKFDAIPVVYGFLYYFLHGLRSRRGKSYILSIPFALYFIVLQQGRALLVAVLLTCLILIVKWSSTARLATLFPKIVITIACISLGFFMLRTDHMSTYGQHLSSAFTVLFSGELTSDDSANVRIYSTQKVLPYIEKHWLLGSGNLSYQWNEGYKSIFGYFYTSDIGLVGVIYLYGIMGTAILLFQFWFAKRYGQKAPTLPLTDASNGMVLFIVISSSVTGLIAHYPAVSLIFIAVLYAASIGVGAAVPQMPLSSNRTSYSPMS